MTNSPSVFVLATTAGPFEPAADDPARNNAEFCHEAKPPARSHLLPDPYFGDLVLGEHGRFADDDTEEDDGHLPLHSIHACDLGCPWKGTVCCLQVVLTEEALAEHRVSLGVLCGLKQFYHPHALPPCVVDCTINRPQPATRAADGVHVS